MASQLAELAIIYFASSQLSATVVCFLLNQAIIPNPNMEQNPKVLFLALASLAHLESTKCSATHYLPHISGHNESCPSGIGAHAL
jgi:hypothetical protein